MPLVPYKNKTPRIHPTSYVSPRAYISGDVEVAGECSIMEGAVIRGDFGAIRIGPRCSIQDNSVIHSGWTPCTIGPQTTLGHGAVLHGCTLEGNTVVGINSTVLDEAHVGEYCLIAAGSVIPQGERIEGHSLVAGNPARVLRRLTPKQEQIIQGSWMTYIEVGKNYKKLEEAGNRSDSE